MRKRMKKVSALILSAALLCSAFVLPEVYAATRVETERKDCSIVVSLVHPSGQGILRQAEGRKRCLFRSPQPRTAALS